MRRKGENRVRRTIRVRVALAAVTATLVAVVSSAPASASYGPLNYSNCTSTAYNGSNWGENYQTSGTSTCAYMLVDLYVQPSGGAAYWDQGYWSSQQQVWNYAPAGTYVVKSQHFIKSGQESRYLYR